MQYVSKILRGAIVMTAAGLIACSDGSDAPAGQSYGIAPDAASVTRKSGVGIEKFPDGYNLVLGTDAGSKVFSRVGKDCALTSLYAKGSEVGGVGFFDESCDMKVDSVVNVKGYALPSGRVATDMGPTVAPYQGADGEYRRLAEELGAIVPQKQ